MQDHVSKHMGIAELAERAETSRRTVRYYIARGLLHGPLRAGRDAFYDEGHLERLERIKALQDKGLTLQDIAHRLNRAGIREPLPAPTSWWQYCVAEDIIVWVKTIASPWRARRVQRALADMARQISIEEVQDEHTG